MVSLDPDMTTPLHLEYDDGGTTVELIVKPLHVWQGLSKDGKVLWFMYVHDLTTNVYLDLALIKIKRFWMPQTAEEMQLSGVAKIKFPFL